MNGVSKVAHQLAHTQALQGHEVEMWGLTPTPDEIMAPRAYQLRLFKQTGHFALDAKLKLALKELPRENICFHIHGGFIFPFYLISRRLFLLRIPYVFTPHGSYSPFAFQRSGWKKKIYFNLFESNMVKRAQTLHFLGKSGFELFDKLMKIDHKVLIPNGQNLEELVFDYEPVINCNYPIFSFCGRLINHYKGLDILLEAFGRYKQNGGKGLLWLIGDGPDKDKLKQLALKWNIDREVFFFGSQYGKDKLSLLLESDAFVHPSRSEGFPTAVLEAAGLGLPCILSEATNVAGYIRQYKVGIALEKNDVHHITEALFQIEIIKKHNGLEEMGHAAHRMVEAEFDWQDIASRLVAVYQNRELVLV